MLMLSFLSEIYFMLVTALTTKKPGGLAHVKAEHFSFYQCLILEHRCYGSLKRPISPEADPEIKKWHGHYTRATVELSMRLSFSSFDS